MSNIEPIRHSKYHFITLIILNQKRMIKKTTQKSYHDYVIKDGEFIGDFENMYRNCEDPWMQSKQPNKYSRLAGIEHLKSFEIKSVLECGSGLGYYADWNCYI